MYKEGVVNLAENRDLIHDVVNLLQLQDFGFFEDFKSDVHILFLPSSESHSSKRTYVLKGGLPVPIV